MNAFKLSNAQPRHRPQAEVLKRPVLMDNKRGLTFPYLRLETCSKYDQYILDTFRKVQHLDCLWQAKQMLYPGKRPDGLIVGGSHDRVEFHILDEKGMPKEPRLAAIYFDTYKIY